MTYLLYAIYINFADLASPAHDLDQVGGVRDENAVS